MTDPIDSLELAEGKRLSVMAAEHGLTAVPMTRGTAGHWLRARPGDGVAEALLDLLVATSGTVTDGRFTVRSWTRRNASGERAVGVDQTNESVIVGEAAVVKWATHLQEGPHPAPSRIATLRAAGFGGMPAPWGLLTWQPPEGAETLVANVDEYLPGAVDGWTWAVDLITGAAGGKSPGPFADATAEVGNLIAELHAALSGTVTPASERDAARWRATALETLETVCALESAPSVDSARARRGEIAAALGGLGALAGTPVIDGHGDLHVGQVLRSGDRFVVTDFDGNPVLPAAERALPVPAGLDVAGLVQSLAHAAIVAGRHSRLDAGALAAVDRAGRTAFLDAYGRRITELGHDKLFDAGPLPGFRLQQVLREIVYAARHLPRWMYVPDAALPALLDDGAHR